MTWRSERFILQLHTDAVGLLDHVAVSDDVAFGIDDHAGSQRTLADVAAVATLAAKEFVEEILETTVVIVAAALISRVGLRRAAAPTRGFDGRLELLGYLRELIGKHLRRGDRQGCGIGRLLSLFAFHAGRNDGSNQNADCQRCQNREGVCPAISFEAHPKSAFARIHFFPPENTCLTALYLRADYAPGKSTPLLDAQNPLCVNQFSVPGSQFSVHTPRCHCFSPRTENRELLSYSLAVISARNRPV